jgi:hypothetical protein
MAVMDNAHVIRQYGARTVPASGRRVRDLHVTPAWLLSEEQQHSAPGGRRGADGSGQ